MGSVGSADYHLLPVDLRDTVGLHERLAAAGVDFTIPTLVVGECVLIYMDAPSSRHLIRWAASAFSSAAFVIYEQILPHDPFGQQMVHNLEVGPLGVTGMSSHSDWSGGSGRAEGVPCWASRTRPPWRPRSGASRTSGFRQGKEGRGHICACLAASSC